MGPLASRIISVGGLWCKKVGQDSLRGSKLVDSLRKLKHSSGEDFLHLKRMPVSIYLSQASCTAECEILAGVSSNIKLLLLSLCLDIATCLDEMANIFSCHSNILC